jgi:hypothetical protein
MTYDTSTQEGRDKRIEQLVNERLQRGNLVGVVSLIGGSVDDYRDYTPADNGEAPKGE